jgi:hypothetical protein
MLKETEQDIFCCETEAEVVFRNVVERHGTKHRYRKVIRYLQTKLLQRGMSSAHDEICFEARSANGD